MSNITKSIFEGIADGKIEQKTGVKILEEIKDIKHTKDEIAIVGMSARFPGADNISEYWYNLENSINCIGELPKHRKKILKILFFIIQIWKKRILNIGREDIR